MWQARQSKGNSVAAWIMPPYINSRPGTFFVGTFLWNLFWESFLLWHVFVKTDKLDQDCHIGVARLQILGAENNSENIIH